VSRNIRSRGDKGVGGPGKAQCSIKERNDAARTLPQTGFVNSLFSTRATRVSPFDLPATVSRADSTELVFFWPFNGHGTAQSWRVPPV